ncbi:MAG: hypothetical protein IH859_01055 [Chloroflexi bacterium]|nr:hypothetical protein [Chloroflexota bacterium]
MKYEEWIQYERARLEDEKRRVIERLERDEEQVSQQAEQDAHEDEPRSNYKDPNPPRTHLSLHPA